MAVDITGFQRMRREQEIKQQEVAPDWGSMNFYILRAAAKEAGIKGYGKMSKAELIDVLRGGDN